MNKMYLKGAILSLILGSSVSYAQTQEDIQMIKRHTNVSLLKQMSKNFSKRSKEAKAEAIKLAKKKGWKIKGTNKNGSLIELMRLTEDNKPVYYKASNVNCAMSTRTNTLNTGGLLGLSLDGQGMTAHVWDGGHALTSHTEYQHNNGLATRVSVEDGMPQANNHAGHVMGTILARGADASAKGMAPVALGKSYEWNQDLAEVSSAASEGMVISNHSYGFDSEVIPDDWFGSYRGECPDWDQILNNAPYYLLLVAAGNDGEHDWLNQMPLDNEPRYDKLAGMGVCKNVLTVANMRDAEFNAQGNLIGNVTRTASSSEGPTDDYRIKPEISGNGFRVYSTSTQHNNAYMEMTGTSMATPNVAGTLLLLQQYHRNIYNTFMRAATLKGLAMHTADDVETNGPDATSGFGLLNAKFAAQTISRNGHQSSIQELILNNGNDYTAAINASGNEELRVSISWSDKPGAINNLTNSHTAALVNDLDLRVTQNGVEYKPWKLTSVSTNAKDDNTVDPYERIDIANANGQYQIRISHKGQIEGESQHFSLIVTGGTVQEINNPPVDVINPPVDVINPPVDVVIPAPIVPDCKNTIFDIKPGKYANEVSWKITNSSDQTVLSGNGYQDFKDVNLEECLLTGCYKFEIKDSYGDGFSSSGSIKMTVNGQTKVDITGNFGQNEIVEFCVNANNEPAPPIDETPGCEDSTIELFTGSYASDISWTIKDSSNTTIQSGDGYVNDEHVNLDECFTSGCYTLEIKDVYGDGLSGGGYLKVKVNGETKASLFAGDYTGHSKTVEFCVGNGAPSPIPVNPIPVNPNPVDPTPVDPVNPGNCGNTQIDIDTGLFASDMSWTITSNGGQVVLEGDNYVSNKIVNRTECLPSGCYTFKIVDAFNDGFAVSPNAYVRVSINNQVVVNVTGNYGSSKTVPFCVQSNFNNGVNSSNSVETADISIYPNPASFGFVTLKSTDILHGKYEIASIEGRLISFGTLEDGLAKVNVQNFKSGTYIVKLSNNKGKSVTKNLLIK